MTAPFRFTATGITAPVAYHDRINGLLTPLPALLFPGALSAFMAGERTTLMWRAYFRHCPPLTENLMKTLKLYEITDAYRQILDCADDPDADVDLDSFIPALDAIEADFSAKAGHIACYVRELELEAVSVMEIADQAKTRAKRLETRAESLRDYLRVQMQNAGIKKVIDPRIALTLRKTPPSVFIPTLDSVPAEERFWRIIPEKWEPDKTAIKEALKSGFAVGDCELRTGERLEIR